MSVLSTIGKVVGTLDAIASLASPGGAALAASDTSVTPSTQKADYCPISFVLDDQTTGELPVSITLRVRPEDLTYSNPSRLTVQQTLGGAWMDNFRQGIPSLNISGHTGWRTGPDGLDGGDRFQQLFDQVYTQWHQRRQNAIASGVDPNLVQLIYSDALNNLSVVVAPNAFVLRRSRQRPLLCMYQIAMTVTNTETDPNANDSDTASGGFLDAADTQAVGLDSFGQSMTDLAGYAANAANFVPAVIAGAVGGFLSMSMGVLGTAMAAVQVGSAVVGQLVAIGQMVASAGITAFQILAEATYATTAGLACIMDIAGVFMNVWCLLNNAINLQLSVPDYSSVFGASNCSSTNGGSPVSVFANANPFMSAAPTPPTVPIAISTMAQQGLVTLSNTDPVMAPMSLTDLNTTMTNVNAGVVVSQ